MKVYFGECVSIHNLLRLDIIPRTHERQIYSENKTMFSFNYVKGDVNSIRVNIKSYETFGSILHNFQLFLLIHKYT